MRSEFSVDVTDVVDERLGALPVGVRATVADVGKKRA